MTRLEFFSVVLTVCLDGIKGVSFYIVNQESVKLPTTQVGTFEQKNACSEHQTLQLLV